MEKLTEALSDAMQFEKKGYDVYISASGKTMNKLAKETLKAIAAKEIDHMNAIERFAKEIASRSPHLSEATKLINVRSKEEYFRGIFEKLKGQLSAEVKSDSDIEKVYEVAMGLERDSFEFYRGMAAASDDPESKKFFEFLMGEEDNHYQILQETLQYLNRPMDWFKDNERWVVEG